MRILRGISLLIIPVMNQVSVKQRFFTGYQVYIQDFIYILNNLIQLAISTSNLTNQDDIPIPDSGNNTIIKSIETQNHTKCKCFF